MHKNRRKKKKDRTVQKPYTEDAVLLRAIWKSTEVRKGVKDKREKGQASICEKE